jgi:hypothetical protein
MTPKEKAEALVERFRMNVLDWDGCSINEHKAKQCALIAVDEIINTATPVYDSFWPMNTKDYWQEVKQEIENI